MYLALGIVFLLATLVMAGFVVVTCVRAARRKGEYISKKNLIYVACNFVIVYLLHITAAAYKGETLNFFYCFSLVDTTLNVFKFKATESLLLPICDAYHLYYADCIIAFILSGITVILSVASFFGRRIGNFIAARYRLKSKCDIVIGDSECAVKYVENNDDCVLLATDVTSARYADLMKQGIVVLRAPLNAKQLQKKLKRGGYNVIVFRDANYSYTNIIETFMGVTYADKIGIHLEANQQEMKILKQKFLTKADSDKNVYITGFSKYELMARRFIVDYPITKYIPRSFYNENFTLKKDKQVNVVFIGFGKVNYQLFRMCAMQFQFAGEEKGKLISRPVNYHIFDNKDSALHNEFFSRIIYEFDEEFSDCDFPKPDVICKLHDNIHRVDINSVDAKKQFKSIVTEDSFTYFIISLDNDLSDASYAQTVKRLLDAEDNYRIFVRAKNNNGERLNETSDKIIYFGDEKNIFTHASIVNDDLTELAQKINLLYNKISDAPAWLQKAKGDKTMTAEQKGDMLNTALAEEENRNFMRSRWFELPNIEQESNLYHALNLPFKLNLLGFDMVKKRDDTDVGITESEFDKRYINSGRATNYTDYSFFFNTESSNVLAFIEHSRWNALYILYDYTQMKKADIRITESADDSGKPIKTMPHKNIPLKTHACLTTYYGLNELIEYKYKALYPNEKLSEKVYRDNPHLQELSKIYAYDYMDLDRLYGEITAMGYKLVPIEDK